MKFFKWFIFIFFLLFSIGCIIGGLNMLHKSYDLKQNGVRAKAILIGYESERVANSRKSGKRYRGSEVYHAKIYKYEVGNDSLISSPKNSSKDVVAEIGVIEEIIYRKDEPTYIAEVKSLNEDLAVSFVPIILGSIVLTITLFIAYRSRKIRQINN